MLEGGEIGDRLWLYPSENLTLTSNDVHVWRARLDLSTSHIRNLQPMLSAVELERAQRFRFREDQTRFIAARATLRAILSHYLGTEPANLKFGYNAYGKPYLADLLSPAELCFNVSHSDQLALYAVACNRSVGIDLERVRPDFPCTLIADQFFSPGEITTLRTLSAHLQHEAFTNGWTRKEAYVKARGEGLTLPLNQFDVSLTPGEPARFLGFPGEPAEAARWSMVTLAPGEGYTGALVAEGHDWRLTHWQWSWELDAEK